LREYSAAQRVRLFLDLSAKQGVEFGREGVGMGLAEVFWKLQRKDANDP
jgi:hypothetical protein